MKMQRETGEVTYGSNDSCPKNSSNSYRSTSCHPPPSRVMINSGEYLFNVISILPDAALSINDSGIILSANDKARKVFDLEDTQILHGKSILDFIRQTNGFSKADIIEMIRTSNVPEKIELTLDRLPGDEKWIECTGSVLPYHTKQTLLLVIRDITKQKLLERKFKEYRDIHRVLTENIEDMLILWDNQVRALYVNPAVKTLLGFDRKDYKNILNEPNPLNKIMAGDSVLKIREGKPELTQNAFKELTTRGPLELELLHRDGRPVWTETKFSYLNDSGGRPSGIISITRDITQHKTTKDKLEKSEKFLRAVLNSTTDGILVVDEAGTVVHWNKQFADMWCLPEEILETRNNAYLLEYVSEQMEKSSCFSYDINNVYKTSGNYYDIRRFKDGRVFEQYSSPLIGETTKSGRVWSFRDITERQLSEKALRESEKRLGLALEGADLHLWEFNLRSRELYIRQQLIDDLGYSGHEIQSHADFLEEIMHPDDTIAYKDAIADHTMGLRPYCECSFRLKDASGENRWILLRGKITERDRSGEPLLMNGTYLDITRQKEAEEKSISYEKQLIQAHKMEAIGTLSAGIAHDFNNILGAILLNTQLAIRESPAQSRNRVLLERVVKASNRAKELVTQILQFSRQSEQERKPVEIIPIIKESLKFLRAMISSDIKISHTIKTQCSRVMIDPTQIYQILLNLCTNAEHAMREHGGVLSVELSDIIIDESQAMHNPELQPGMFLNLSVSDTGYGISQEIIDRIFDPFFTTKNPGEGTGMGLSVVHGIVKSYGGTILIESSPSHGTRFDILLPKAEIEMVPEIPESTFIPHGSEHILLVDDEKDLIKIEKQILESLGYRVTGQTDPIGALEYFRENPSGVDIVITDMTMPGMPGTELAMKLKNIRKDLPVILCTGYNVMLSPEKIEDLGIDKLLLKPVGHQALAESIRSVLDT